jgi:methyltransferase family protein
MSSPEDTQNQKTTSRSERTAPDSFLTIEGQRRFLDTFLPIRNQVIHDFYHSPGNGLPTGQDRRQNLRAAIRLLGGGADETVPDIYRLYYNRLFSAIWLALNWGPYTEEIRQLTDPQLRVYHSQLNSVDTCWQPAVEDAPDDGLLVEIGTGLSDGWARIALLKPHINIVSITIESDQAEIARSIADRLDVADRVQIRVGDIYDPDTTSDLAGRADAVTAMGVLPHLPDARKAEGLSAMASMLKPEAPLLIFDGYRVRPFRHYMTRALASNRSPYPSSEEFTTALNDAGLSLTRFDTYTAESCLQIAADTRTTPQLRREVGPVIAWLFTRVVRQFMKDLLKPQESVHLSAVRQRQQ